MSVSLGFKMSATSTSGGELLEQTSAEGGLPGPDLAGELDEAASLADSVQKVRQALAVPAAHVEVAWIRRDGKRGFRQTEMRGVDDTAARRST